MTAELAAPFTDHYETLRAWVLSRPHPLPCPSGLAVLLCRGLPAWLVACSTWQAATTGPRVPLSTPAAEPSPTAATHAALILILTTMVISAHKEDQS